MRALVEELVGAQTVAEVVVARGFPIGDCLFQGAVVDQHFNRAQVSMTTTGEHWMTLYTGMGHSTKADTSVAVNSLPSSTRLSSFSAATKTNRRSRPGECTRPPWRLRLGCCARWPESTVRPRRTTAVRYGFCAWLKGARRCDDEESSRAAWSFRPDAGNDSGDRRTVIGLVARADFCFAAGGV